MRTDHIPLPHRYLRTKKAAQFLSLSARTLEKHRTYGTGPAYHKLGGRVVYSVEDLEAWVRRGAVTSTSDPRGGQVLPARRVLTAIPPAGRRFRSPGGVNPMPRHPSERAQLELFRSLPGDLAPRDAQDLMAYPFVSLSKSPRIRPIDFAMGGVEIRVEAVPDHGMATIWDADILIWAASQIVEARDAGLRTSRLMAATPYEILTFIGRGTSARDYQRLKAALDRLQSTTICTTLRQPQAGRRHRFSWINEWQGRSDSAGRTDGIEMILPDWFYRAVLDDALILTIDRAYFSLTGGLERWLYRLVRKHGGRQHGGWRFEFRHLHVKSGSLSPFRYFAHQLRDLIRRQPLPGYRLALERGGAGQLLLAFAPCGQAVDGLVLSPTPPIVPSQTGDTCYRKRKTGLTSAPASEIRPLNLESNKDSNSCSGLRAGKNPAAAPRSGPETGTGTAAPARPFGPLREGEP